WRRSWRVLKILRSSRGRRQCPHRSPVAAPSRVSCQPAPDSTSMATCGMVTFQQAVRKRVLGFLKRGTCIAVSRLHSVNGCNLATMERLCRTLRRFGGQNSRGIETRSTSTFRDDLGTGTRFGLGFFLAGLRFTVQIALQPRLYGSRRPSAIFSFVARTSSPVLRSQLPFGDRI